MIKLKDKESCCGCYACYNICPKKCISMSADKEGFWYPKIDENKCINCNLCEKVCPILNKPKANKSKEEAYAVINKDEKIRLESSSGGIFTLLAQHVINKNGVVYGAAFDEIFNVHHIRIDSIDDIKYLRGSKYTQSAIKDSYSYVRNDLINSKLVLFTGTPCQVNGLRSFLQKDYDNLILMDIICHGVPSPLVWSEYVKLRANKADDVIQQIAFRSKDESWKQYAVKFSFANSTAYFQNLNEDIFMRGFLTDLYLRPSCYECHFKDVNRISDITIADFWGIQNELPDMDDDKGTSFVVVHSEKGKELFNSLKGNLKYVQVDINTGIKYNPSMIRSVAYNEKRKLFFNDLSNSNDLLSLIDKYTKLSFTMRIKRKVKSIIKRILGMN